jgi:hypothetical protein
MPSHNQNTIDIPSGGTGHLGSTSELSRSNTNSLKASFPGSPIHSGLMTRESIQEHYQDYVLNGEVLDGYCFSYFSLDYDKGPKAVCPPVIVSVKSGGKGLPGSPHMPNPVSPGPGSVNPKDQANPPDGLEKNKTSRPPFVGEGTALDPMKSSKRQSTHKIKKYIMGKSNKESVGSYGKS